jgi:hypothetical protein
MTSPSLAGGGVAGDNSTDDASLFLILPNGARLHRGALAAFNYTLYAGNGTLSNASRCYLAFGRSVPTLLANGSVVDTPGANGTNGGNIVAWCYAPHRRVRARGALGIACAALFAASLVATLVNLRRHGRRWLPAQRRFGALGRRAAWYWLLVVGAGGMAGTLAAIDVDRDYLPALSLILQGFFFFMGVPALLAALWESVRHW